MILLKVVASLKANELVLVRSCVFALVVKRVCITPGTRCQSVAGSATSSSLIMAPWRRKETDVSEKGGTYNYVCDIEKGYWRGARPSPEGVLEAIVTELHRRASLAAVGQWSTGGTGRGMPMDVNAEAELLAESRTSAVGCHADEAELGIAHAIEAVLEDCLQQAGEKSERHRQQFLDNLYQLALCGHSEYIDDCEFTELQRLTFQTVANLWMQCKDKASGLLRHEAATDQRAWKAGSGNGDRTGKATLESDGDPAGSSHVHSESKCVQSSSSTVGVVFEQVDSRQAFGESKDPNIEGCFLNWDPLSCRYSGPSYPNSEPSPVEGILSSNGKCLSSLRINPEPTEANLALVLNPPRQLWS